MNVVHITDSYDLHLIEAINEEENTRGKVSPFLFFYDLSDVLHFQNFCAIRTNIFTALPSASISFSTLILLMDKYDKKDSLPVIFILFCAWLACGSSTTLILLSMNWIRGYRQFYFMHLENIVAVSQTLTFSLILYLRKFESFCSDNNRNGIFSLCQPKPEMSDDTCQYLLVFLMPVIASCISPNCSWRAVIFCWIIAVFFTLLTIFSSGDFSYVGFTILMSLISFLIIHEKRRQAIKNFLVYKHLLGYLGLKKQSKIAEIKYNNAVSQQNELRQTIFNISHDLKTPTSALATGSELLLNVVNKLQSVNAYTDAAIPSETERTVLSELGFISNTLSEFQHSCSFMMMTVNRFTDFSRTTFGLPLIPALSVFALEDVVLGAVKCIEDSSLYNPIKVVLKAEKLTLARQIRSDKQWLEESLLCLLSNAVKFGGSGGDVAVSVQITKINALDYIRFEVQDCGTGVSLDVRDKLFEPLQQSAGRKGSSGLGLFVLAKRMDSLEGSCGYCPRKDQKQGSLFWFCVPYRPAVTESSDKSIKQSLLAGKRAIDADNSSIDKLDEIRFADATLPRPKELAMMRNDSLEGVTEPKDKKAFTRPSVSGREVRSILVVDESLPILKMTTRLLEREGYSTAQALNGFEALRILKNQRFDLIILDTELRVMDGSQVIEKIRSFEVTSNFQLANRIISDPASNAANTDHQFIIGCSVHSDQLSAQEAMQAGVDAFIAKPFTMYKLKEVLYRFN